MKTLVLSECLSVSGGDVDVALLVPVDADDFSNSPFTSGFAMGANSVIYVAGATIGALCTPLVVGYRAMKMIASGTYTVTSGTYHMVVGE